MAKGPVARSSPKLHQLAKLFVTGDFDGDQRPDTIYQSTVSGVTKKEISRAPAPVENEWDTVAQWFRDQRADVVLTLSSAGLDTLHLGTGQGLYCLLNVGDNNADGKDEVAFVVDYCDDSQVNSCRILSLCNEQWVLLKRFSIHESAFDYPTRVAPKFSEINGFLVRKNGQWLYADYEQAMLADQDSPESAGLQRLLLARCQ